MEDSKKFVCELIGQEVKYKGDFLSYINKYYSITKNGETSKVTWETVEYPPKDKRLKFGVSIVPIIKGEKKMIIIENFRYGVNKHCLEFPAGMIDKEDIESLNQVPLEEQKKAIEQIAIKAAKRELKEETGYDGDFKQFMTLPIITDPIKVLSNVYSDPWKSSDACAQCLFEIDKTLPSNQSPSQHLDSCESIKIHEVSIDSLLNFISLKINNEGLSCQSDLYSFAMGMHFNTILSSHNSS